MKQVRGVPYFICNAILLAACIGLIYWTVRLAYASLVSRSRAPGAIQRATQLDPWNASYFAELAARSDRTTGAEALRRATELDPLNSAYWIRRGVSAEFAGDPKAAERFYLQASRVSRLFGPRIMLANFYFRQGEPEDFWKWAHAAFAMSYGDLEGAFVLCWQVAPDAQVILDRALPGNVEVLAQFLGFVIRHAGLEAARPVVAKLLGKAGRNSQGALLNYCDGLLAAKRPEEAYEVWQGLGRRGLTAAAGGGGSQNLLYNAGLAATPLACGFDWRVVSTPEVSAAASGKPGEIGITFSGNQAEEGEVLSQVVALRGGASYRFSLAEHTVGSSDPGLTWSVEDADTGRELASLAIAATEDWVSREVQFQAAQDSFVRVVLKYRRKAGTVRYEGQVLMRELQLARSGPAGPRQDRHGRGTATGANLLGRAIPARPGFAGGG